MLNRLHCFLFDYNPWKSAVIVLIISNFLFLANAEIVLIISLTLIFIYLILFSVSAFSSYSDQKIGSRLTTYSNLHIIIIGLLERAQAELDKTSGFVSAISPLLSTWTARSLLYRCLEIKKTKNLVILPVVGLLEFFKNSHASAPTINFSSLNEKTSFLLSTLV